MLEGIKAEAGEGVEVVHAVGVDPGRHNRAYRESAFTSPDGSPGLKAEYYNNLDLAGEPDRVQVEEFIDHRWMTKPPAEGIDKARHSIRWTGTLRVETGGEYVFYQQASDGEYVARIGDQVLFDTWGSEESGPASGRLTLEAGRDYDVLLQYRPVRGWNSFCFGYEPVSAIEADVQAALAAAQGADAAIYCGGHTRESEGEGFDRSFGIDEEQQELIRRLGQAAGRLVLVLTAGGNVDMGPWIDSVDALLHAWYPGQEGGRAVAEIVLGRTNPSGKLPATFESRLEDRSSFACYHDDDHDKRVALSDGVFTGYRHADAENIEPRFAFGFGLSYTTFALENLRLSSRTVSAEESLAVTFDVLNTGSMAGAEVAQVYVADVEASVPRPPKELKGFVKVALEPGERKTVSVPLDARAWSFFDPTLRDWVVEPGRFRVLVGVSARDIHLEADVTVRG
jgi:beta-glucosidase